MKYFLDSAKVDEIRYARDNWGIDGVTTNPRHILESKKPFHAVIREIAALEPGPISVEVDPYLDTADKIEAEARTLSAIADSFVIKVPCNEQGLIAARRLEAAGIRTNVTLVFSASQALQAGRIGAAYVSPFVGWREAHGEHGSDLIEEISAIYSRYEFKTEVIVAAVRNGRQIADAALAGADIVTAGLDVYRQSFEHPHTGVGLDIFRAAWEKVDASS